MQTTRGSLPRVPFYPIYKLENVFSVPRNYKSRRKLTFLKSEKNVKIDEVVMDKSSIWEGRNMTFT